jgi:hypothetical protein
VSIDIQATKELRQRAREEQDMWVCPRVIRIRPKITPPPIEERLMESEVDVEITILDDETFDKDALEYPLDEDIPF